MEYISREELMRTLKPFVIKKGVMENIKAIPNADVRENIHGEWIKDEKMSIVFDIYRCSRCSADGEPRYNFCPNCGAKMKNEEE